MWKNNRVGKAECRYGWASIALRLVVVGIVTAVGACDRSTQEQPNIVIILADDMGIGDISAYNVNSKIKTPHLDGLVAAGAMFTDASTPASVCTPTRYSILTGRYAWRTRLKSQVLWVWDKPLIDTRTVTLPETLRSSGYTTAMFGKWHLGWEWPTVDSIAPIGQGLINPPFTSGKNIDFTQPIKGGPTDHGFDYYFGVDVPNFPPYAWIKNDRLVEIPNVVKPKQMFGANGPMVEGWSLEAIAPTLTDKIVEYIRKTKNQKQPFFLYYAMTSPHTPIVPVPEWRGSSKAGLYGDFVQQLDAEIGRIVTAIEESNKSENTIIIFMADNGSAGMANNRSRNTALLEKFNHATSLDLKGYKLSVYQGGFRVPMVVVWPNKIAPGSRIDKPFTALDLMPTLAHFANASLEAGAAPDAFNVSSDWLNGGPQSSQRKYAIYHSFDGTFALRQGRYKLIAGEGDGARRDASALRDVYRLYDLQADPQETTDISLSEPVQLEKMKTLLLSHDPYSEH